MKEVNEVKELEKGNRVNNQKSDINHDKKNTKKYLKVLFVGLIILVIVILIIYFKAKPEREIRTFVKSSQEEVFDTEELRTEIYTYNGIASKCKGECDKGKDNKYLYHISYKGEVTIGIDLKKLKVNFENKKVIITIPEPYISGVNIKMDDFNSIFIDKSYDTPNEMNEIHKLCLDDLTANVSNNEMMINTAKESAKRNIMEFYKMWLNNAYKDYTLEVR